MDEREVRPPRTRSASHPVLGRMTRKLAGTVAKLQDTLAEPGDAVIAERLRSAASA